MQVPVIMGVLGNNAKTKLLRGDDCLDLNQLVVRTLIGRLMLQNISESRYQSKGCDLYSIKPETGNTCRESTDSVQLTTVLICSTRKGM